jgi:hypothetical protein
MQDRNAYRLAAAECLEIAKITLDQKARARLVVLASKLLDMAHDPDDEALRVLLDGFNELQMRK